MIWSVLCLEVREYTWSGRGGTLHVGHTLCAYGQSCSNGGSCILLPCWQKFPPKYVKLGHLWDQTSPSIVWGFSQIDLTYFVKYIFIWHEENRYGRNVNLSEFLCATFCLSKHWKSVILGNKFLNYFKGFNVFCMNNTLLEVCLLHEEIFQHLLQLGYGSTAMEIRSVHSCFPSSTNLIWIENGYLISFEDGTVVPCWLLGATIKSAGSRLTHQFRSFYQIWSNRVRLYWVSMIFTQS